MQITVHFETELKPGNDHQKVQILKTYLQGKGVAMEPYQNSNTKNHLWLEINETT